MSVVSAKRPKSSPHVFRNGNNVILDAKAIDGPDNHVTTATGGPNEDMETPETGGEMPEEEPAVDQDISEEVDGQEVITAVVPISRDQHQMQISSRLNFDKVKVDLTISRQGVLLLQALRWVSRNIPQ